MELAINASTKKRLESSGFSADEVVNAGIDTIAHDPHGWKWLEKQIRPILDAPSSEFVEVTSQDLKAEARQKYQVS